MSVHIHRVPETVREVKPDGEPRWCFYCRKSVPFVSEFRVPESCWYDPYLVVKCEPNGHTDGDLFPGRYRILGSYL